MRDSLSNLIYAQALRIEFYNALEDEVKAFKGGLIHYVKNNLLPLIMKNNSVLIITKDIRWGLGNTMRYNSGYKVYSNDIEG